MTASTTWPTGSTSARTTTWSPFYVVLAARLRALLRRGAVPRPAVLRAGDLALDPGSRSVQRGAAVVQLTARVSLSWST